MKRIVYMKELQYLNKYFLKYKWKLLLGLVITILAQLFAIFVPRYVGDVSNLIADYMGGKIEDTEFFKKKLFQNIGLIFGTAIISAIFTFIMRQTFIVVSRYIEYDLKNEIYAHYQRLTLSFYKENRTGDLMNRISEDVSRVRNYLGPALMYGVTSITLFMVALAFMIHKAPLLTLYTAIPFPILSFLVYKLSQAIHKRSTIVQQYLSKLSSFTQESFSGIAVIKSFGIETQTDTRFNALSDGSKEKQIDLAKVEAFFLPLIILLIGGSNILVIYIGGHQLITGQIDGVGTIVEFLLYVNMLTWPVTSIGFITNMIQRAEASQKRINEFLSVDPEIYNPTETPSNLNGKIEFKNVSFTYRDTSITALKNVSFKLKPGETLGIIGKTGSGKTTLLDLIGRLYDVESGAVLIDGKDVRTLNLDSLRKSIGYVPQDAFLFSDSIMDNIKFGNDQLTDEEAIQAAKDADIHKNISEFKRGYDTILGERGLTLSGGQKQRLSIARALVLDPNIFLFDDCLSAVDTETEEAILENLSKVSQRKTTLIVSHRISSIKNADKIIVLDHGRIVQEGTHESLLKQPGHYQDLYKKQLDEKED